MEPVLMENIHHQHNKDLEKGAIWIVKKLTITKMLFLYD